METSTNIAAKINGLWKNGRDSIEHALDHFVARRQGITDILNHDKWIVMSVHQAAECISNILLLQIEPNCPLFVRNGKPWFPSLTETLQRFKWSGHLERLSAAECQLLALLDHLPDIRHQFMHRIAPEELDLSITAMCMIGLLKHIELRMGTAASDIVWQDSPIKSDVVAAIRYTHLTEYNQFVDLFLREKYPDHFLPECPMCGVAAVVGSTCEACFEELDYILCPTCDERVCFMASEQSRGEVPVECPYCGGTLAWC
jgi:hypothetical protein